MEIKQKKRDEIPAQYKWDLTNLFPTDADWRKSADSIEAEIELIKEFEGKLTTGEGILACFEKYWTVYEKQDRIYQYAHLKQSEDSTVSASQAMVDIADGLETDFEEASAFIQPEILAHDEATIRSFIAATPGLKMYEHYFNNLLRQKAHVLSTEMEELLASAGEMADTAENAFEMLQDADLKFGSITDENGNTVEVTEGRYFSLLESTDRRVRKDAFETYWDAYLKLKNTLTTLRSSSIKKDIFFAKARKYPSTLDAALHESNIPRAVYEKLIEVVHEFLPVMHRYTALRKKVLKLDELHTYDRFVSLVEGVDTKVSYEAATEMLMEGLAPLGKEYLNEMKKGIESGWIDVYENEGKTSGGFEWSSLGMHPYVLMNYEDNYDSMFTFAHEMGHAMHDWYTGETQPHVYADSSIFVSEIASTVNETLMIEHMLKTVTDPTTRIYMLDKYTEQFRGTIFNQTMFAEFEKISHSMAEEGEPLTSESLNKVYHDLNVKYNGPDMVIDEQLEFGWATIPHFYRAFYVYQYATGYAAALAFTKRLQSGDPKALEDYLGFLKAGDSGYSIDVLKKAGVDMSSPEPIREALKVFEGIISELEKAFQ